MPEFPTSSSARPRSGPRRRPADIPAPNGVCALAGCQMAAEPDTRFVGLIQRAVLHDNGAAEPSRWVVVACSAEHLELLEDRLRGEGGG